MEDIYYKVAHRSQGEIDSFKTRYDDFDSSLIPQIFKKSLNLTVKTVKPSKSWGSSHVIYFVTTKEKKETLVFRANLGFNPQPETVMLAEKLITDQVDQLGIPTNIILYVDISRKTYPFDFQIQKKLIGNDLEDHFHGTQKQYDQMSYELGAYVARYHQLKYSNFGLFNDQSILKEKLEGSKSNFFDYIITCLDSDLKYLADAKVLSIKKVDTIRKLFDQYKSIINIDKGSLIHHDLADHNIMFKGKQITGIFDWEAAVIGDPVLDLASCPTWRTHYPREKQLLAGYQSITPLPDHFSDKKNIYLLRTMLWKMVFAIRANILTPDREKRLWDALQLFKIKQ
jgi:aminoglycoside phosphotransferase (APT) family kinase protein